MTLHREIVDQSKFNKAVELPYQLRLADFELAMQDVYDFFYDVNGLLLQRGLHRMDDMLRPAAMSGMISDMLTASVAKHSRETDHLTEPAINRAPMRFTEVYIAQVVQSDFRNNPRGGLGTRTATLDRAGIQKLRANWVYLVNR
ncbi:MAG: hypothetical protein M3Z96_09725 [Pseudomonadota bacterium]|nr:hypothetical protein [Pseudomonadota bacterium]